MFIVGAPLQVLQGEQGPVYLAESRVQTAIFH